MNGNNSKINNIDITNNDINNGIIKKDNTFNEYIN